MKKEVKMKLQAILFRLTSLFMVGACSLLVPHPVSAQNYALSFDGVNDMAKILDNPLLSGGPGKSLTVEAWVKMQRVSEEHNPLVVKYYDPSYKDWGLDIESGMLNVNIENADEWSCQAGLVPVGKWTHLAFTFDNTGNVVRLYVNGVEAGTGFRLTKDMPNTAADIWLGAHPYNSIYRTFGILDEVRIWNHARSITELQSTMNLMLTGTEPGLIGYWPFDEGSGQLAADLTGNGNHARLGVGNNADSSDPAWVISDAPVSPMLWIPFAPSHDAHVRWSSPTENYGSRPSLLQRLSDSEMINTYLKFNVAGLNAPATPIGVRRAKLRLYVTDASEDGGSVYIVSNNHRDATTPWTEMNLNWNNAPIISGTVLSAAGAVRVGSWVELDVTAAIPTGRDSTYSFGLKNNSTNVVYYSSKEGTNAPELVIQVARSALPMPTIAAFTPTSGTEGMEITIIGMNFNGTTEVAFNGTVATSFTIDSDTQLRAIVPLGASTGAIRITNAYGFGFSTADFTVVLPPGAFAFTPEHDTYVRWSSPASNNGDAGTLRLEKDMFSSYLKFNITGLNGSAAPVEVHSAKLRLYVTNTSDDGGSVHIVSNNLADNTTPWTEDNLTGENAPAINSPALSTLGPISLDSLVEFDVTAAITGDGIYSFGLKNNSSDRAYYSSTEGTRAPLLIIKTSSSPPTALQLTSPNGGERWITGSSQNITWTSTGILANVKLEFSTNNGTNWTTIIASTPNDGSYSWTIPADLSSQCLLRISDAADGEPLDVSDAVFAIVAPSQDPNTLIFRPTDDAYVRLSSATTNYGLATTLRQRKTSADTTISYLKFNISGLIGTIQSAKLRLFVVDPSIDGGSVYAVSNNYKNTTGPWTETGITWNRAPLIAGSPLDTAGLVNLGTWIELDVTAAISGNGIYSFALRNNSIDIVLYSSKEGTYPPELIIQTTASPPTLSSFTPPSGPVGTVVTILGSDFLGTTEVTFNGTAATFTVISSTEIQATVPEGVPQGGNKITVTTLAGSSTSASDFVVIADETTTTVTFTPTEDAYVRSSRPNSNYGAVTTVRLRKTSSEAITSYLKFNVSGLSGVVQSAKLRLYVTLAGSDGGSVFVVSNNYQSSTTPWTESGLRWNNAPAISGAALSSTGPLSLETWVELEVTPAITGDGLYSFGLENNTSDYVYYSSSEGLHAPELVIQTNSSSSSALKSGELAELENEEAVTPFPENIVLYPNHPNPFNAQTMIEYALSAAAPVRLLIFDMTGRLVRRLVDGVQQAGSQRMIWDGRDEQGVVVSSGIYLVRLEAGNEILAHKMSILR
jgi:hypothetical protein